MTPWCVPFCSTSGVAVVVRAFARDRYVMGMAFTQTGTRNANEGRFFLIVGNVLASHITHGSLEAACKLMDDGSNWPLIGNLSFDTFRHQLQRVGNLCLEIAIC